MVVVTLTNQVLQSRTERYGLHYYYVIVVCINDEQSCNSGRFQCSVVIMAIFCIFVSAVVVLAGYVATCVASLFAASDGSEFCPSGASAGQ